MRKMVLTTGAPDESDTGDFDGICAQPSVEAFFAALFREVTNTPLPALSGTSEEVDDETCVRVGWYGDQGLGIEVTVVKILESSMFATRCRWQTHGLPGMSIDWRYFLEYAGQLGHVAYRHGRVECTFDNDSDQEKFVQVWRLAIGKIPEFAAA